MMLPLMQIVVAYTGALLLNAATLYKYSGHERIKESSQGRPSCAALLHTQPPPKLYIIHHCLIPVGVLLATRAMPLSPPITGLSDD